MRTAFARAFKHSRGQERKHMLSGAVDRLSEAHDVVIEVLARSGEHEDRVLKYMLSETIDKARACLRVTI